MLAERLTSQGLGGAGFGTPEEVVGRILAVQAQDGKGMRLAVRARSRGLVAADVDRALNERSMVVTWLNRGTLHLVLAEDYPWLQAVTAPRHLKWNATRLGQEGVSPDEAERGVGLIADALGSDGPLSRSSLRERLDSGGVPTAGQALNHLLVLASLRGLIVRGPVVEGEQAFVLVGDWLGPTPEVDPETALGELARRYLSGHGPATDRDLAKWAGITLGPARAGLKSIAGELEEAGDGMVDLSGREAQEEVPPPKLLGPFDPVLHGWASREFLIPSADDRAVVTVNGIFRPTALVDGRVAGIWSDRKGSLEMVLFRRVAKEDRAALGRDFEGLRAFLD